MTKSKRRSLYVGIFLVLLGLPGIIATMAISSHLIFTDSELPNSGIDGIVVDSSGNIFLGLAGYGKMQVYDKEGNFVRHWPIKSEGGTFKLSLDPENYIEVITARGDKVLTYDEYGKLILETGYLCDYSTYDKMYPATSFRTKNGDLYEVNGIVYPTIIKNGNIIEPLIEQNIILRILQGPWPTWFFFAAGIFLIVYAYGGFDYFFSKMNKS